MKNNNIVKTQCIDASNHCVSSGANIQEAMAVIEQGEDRICFLINADYRLHRVITDGDIRRALLKGSALTDPVSSIHQRHPTFALTYQTLEEAQQLFSNRVNAVPVLDTGGKVVGLLRQQDALLFLGIRSRKISIVGLGYVGLTLGLVLAERGFSVVGFDRDIDLIKKLRKKEPPFFEDGLELYLDNYIGHSFLLTADPSSLHSDVYIIAVGTPFDKKQLKPNDEQVRSAVTTVAYRIKPGDLLIMRSTLPIGWTREFIVPLLEEITSLVAGKDFFVAYCPERTAEGRALIELKNLPQIVGGLSPKCRELSMRLFSEHTHTVIDVGSLEAAEMCKLMDNAYRDVRFAFSNQMAMIGEKLGVNLKEVIEKVNIGYERNDIPFPSPGVGGACLSKDPYILIRDFERFGLNGDFFLEARKINESAPDQIINRASDILKSVGKELNECKIFIIGFAFKGEPETSDLRQSTTLWLLDRLKLEGNKNIYGYDPVVGSSDIKKFGINTCSLEEGFINADIAFLMNNHRSYAKIDIGQCVQIMNKPALFFDAWQVFQQKSISMYPGIIYSSVGY